MDADFDIRTSVSLLGDVRELQNQAAWARFTAHYLPMIQSWAKRFGLTDSDADELTSRLLVKLVEGLPKFEYNPLQGRFRGWLKTVTQRELVTFARERKRKKAQGAGKSFFDDIAAVDELVTGLHDRSELMLRGLQEALNEVQASCQGDELKSWEAFRRIVLEGGEIGATAAELGLTYHAAAMRVQRIKKKVRERALKLSEPQD